MSAVRYPAKAIARAREHRAAGWSYERTAALIGDEFGTRPTPHSVWYWLNHEGSRVQNERKARQMRDRQALERMILLRTAGVSLRSIGIVAGLWWGEPLTEGQVRYRLRNA